MILARVSGSLVASHRCDEVEGARYLMVTSTDSRGLAKGSAMIALDTVGAGQDEIVLVAQGSSARQTKLSDKKAIDAVIIGIVDQVDVDGALTYRK